jgi:phosphoribosylaminoimidazole-succinocarboxamide synthase
MMMDVSSTYIDIAERITGRPLEVSENPRDDIIRVLREELGIIQD